MQRSHLLPVSQQRSQTSIELLYKKTLVAAKVRVSHYPVSLIIIHTKLSSRRAFGARLKAALCAKSKPDASDRN